MSEVPTIEDMKALVSKETGLSESALDLDAPIDSLGIASIDIVSLIFALDDKYGVEIQSEDLPAAKSLGELLNGIIELIDRKQHAPHDLKVAVQTTPAGE